MPDEIPQHVFVIHGGTNDPVGHICFLVRPFGSMWAAPHMRRYTLSERYSGRHTFWNVVRPGVNRTEQAYGQNRSQSSFASEF